MTSETPPGTQAGSKAATLLLALVAAAALAGPPHALVVGREKLVRGEGVGTWCGRLVRALDPSGRVPGTLAFYYEYYPAARGPGPVQATLVAAESGPGYPMTGSRDE